LVKLSDDILFNNLCKQSSSGPKRYDKIERRREEPPLFKQMNNQSIHDCLQENVGVTKNIFLILRTTCKELHKRIQKKVEKFDLNSFYNSNSGHFQCKRDYTESPHRWFLHFHSDGLVSGYYHSYANELLDCYVSSVIGIWYNEWLWSIVSSPTNKMRLLVNVGPHETPEGISRSQTNDYVPKSVCVSNDISLLRNVYAERWLSEARNLHGLTQRFSMCGIARTEQVPDKPCCHEIVQHIVEQVWQSTTAASRISSEAKEKITNMIAERCMEPPGMTDNELRLQIAEEIHKLVDGAQ